MPGFDRKGPEGDGPMTGRRLGKCTTSKDQSKDDRSIEDDDFGRGRGRRFGFGGGGRRGRG
jgi:hypothetical protein